MSWRLFYDIVNNEIWGDFVILSPLGMNGLIASNTCTKIIQTFVQWTLDGRQQAPV